MNHPVNEKNQKHIKNVIFTYASGPPHQSLNSSFCAFSPSSSLSPLFSPFYVSSFSPSQDCDATIWVEKCHRAVVPLLKLHPK